MDAPLVVSPGTRGADVQFRVSRNMRDSGSVWEKGYGVEQDGVGVKQGRGWSDGCDGVDG